jgi:hypothetical protein
MFECFSKQEKISYIGSILVIFEGFGMHEPFYSFIFAPTTIYCIFVR